LYVAVTVTVVAVATGVLVTEKFALLWPLDTVTLDGRLVTALLSCRLTTTPPLGAGPVRVTVPVEVTPPTMAVGFNATDDKAGGLTVNVADALALYVAVMLAVVVVETAREVTVNVAVDALPGTVTLAETVAALVLLLESRTTAPLSGAGPVRVTVPVVVVPPVTEDGDRVTD
jgi:hypothetical protein